METERGLHNKTEGGVKMDLFDIASDLENLITTLDRSRAVGGEVDKYFETTDRGELMQIVNNSEHLSLLLDAADILLLDLRTGLVKITGELYALHRANKGEGPQPSCPE